MKVAVAVIIDSDGRFLITKRSATSSHPGLWEFPGGKVEDNESELDALLREIKEEVDLNVTEYHILGEIHHTYPKHHVSLMVYHVSGFTGKAFKRENQADLRWVSYEALKEYSFPAANEEIMKLIEKQLIKI